MIGHDRSRHSSALALLRKLALLAPVHVAACSTTAITDVATQDAVTSQDISTDRASPIRDVPDPQAIDVPDPQAVDASSPDVVVPSDVVASCDGYGADADVTSLYRAVNPGGMGACFTELAPHVGQACDQPGYRCWCCMGSAYTCPLTCPRVWTYVGVAGPLAPPTLLA